MLGSFTNDDQTNERDTKQKFKFFKVSFNNFEHRMRFLRQTQTVEQFDKQLIYVPIQITQWFVPMSIIKRKDLYASMFVTTWLKNYWTDLDEIHYNME